MIFHLFRFAAAHRKSRTLFEDSSQYFAFTKYIEQQQGESPWMA